MKIKLTVVILNYNTAFYLKECLISLKKIRKEVNFEVFVIDNGSKDGSVLMVKRDFPWVEKIIKNKTNIGFAAGNNKAKPYARGEFVLFLNPDTIVKKGSFKKPLEFMEENKDVGAVTCKIVLPDGNLDKDSRRSFVTPWTGLTHIYLKLDRIFPKSKIFAKYWYGYISADTIHEVDALQGAYFMTRKKILDSVEWFDEDYFLNGEDIDLSWKIKNKGWKIFYYPLASIVHVKGVAKGKVKSKNYKIPLREKLKYRLAEVNAMELFFRKRLWDNYPLLYNYFVLSGIKILKFVRVTRTLILR
jgi:GT2 family glycosyltransferase